MVGIGILRACAIPAPHIVRDVLLPPCRGRRLSLRWVGVAPVAVSCRVELLGPVPVPLLVPASDIRAAVLAGKFCPSLRCVSLILPTLRVRVESGVAMGPGVVVIELSVIEVADAFVEGIWGKPQRGVGIL